ncbi:MAG: MaoC/PaaZ C-terminal domain-containing protein [Candidatus Alcyoniella australis]|nr:MaoC/PaaZ C-terminal domain-containing protein [Candidatus Alcyoniella australis]
MKISTELWGAALDEHSVDIDWRATTNYAAGAGDLNPRYLDDTHPQGMVAPPMFAVALTWPMIQGIQTSLGDRLQPEVVMTMVHSSEHLILHQPIKPGSRVTINGEVAAVLPGRSGTRVVLRLDARDQAGAALFTEFCGATFRGVQCDGEAAGRDDLPPLPDPPQPGDALWEHELQISPAASFVYDGCSDIVFPIHTSVGFAKAVGLPGIILQGTATLAMAAAVLLTREAGNEPERLAQLACRFSDMVLPGTAIRVRLLRRQAHEHGTELSFEVLNSAGSAALSAGYALVR